MWMPTARNEICALRGRPARVPGVRGQSGRLIGISSSCSVSAPRKKSDAVPDTCLRLAILSGTQTATGSTSIIALQWRLSDWPHRRERFAWTNQITSDTARCFQLPMVLDLGCGTKLLTCGYSALALAATKYRRCYASTFATDHATRLVLFAQKIRAVNLAPSHHHAHRECTVIEVWFCSLRAEVCAVYFQNRPARKLQLPTSHR